VLIISLDYSFKLDLEAMQFKSIEIIFQFLMESLGLDIFESIVVIEGHLFVLYILAIPCLHGIKSFVKIYKP